MGLWISVPQLIRRSRPGKGVSIGRAGITASRPRGRRQWQIRSWERALGRGGVPEARMGSGCQRLWFTLRSFNGMIRPFMHFVPKPMVMKVARVFSEATGLVGLNI